MWHKARIGYTYFTLRPFFQNENLYCSQLPNWVKVERKDGTLEGIFE